MIEGVEEQAQGRISIRIHSQYLNSFDEQYFKLDPFVHDENPWFREFWEDKFHCKMPAERMKTVSTFNSTSSFTSTHNETKASVALPLKHFQQVPFCTGK